MELASSQTEASPTRMHVAFALFEGDELLHRGEFLVAERKGLVVYGEHHHVPLQGGEAFAHRPEFQLFAGLVIEHSFELPACPVELRFYTVALGAQDLRFHAALRMGVHESEDWESVDLGAYTFAFRCAPST
jgi:hypothetical protein